MQKYSYAGEDLVLIAKADTGATVEIQHTLPDKSVVASNVAMTEDGTTGNFYHTFNHADVGTHLLKLVSTDDPDIDGHSLSIVNFATSNADLAIALTAMDGKLDSMDTKLDNLATAVSGISGAVENTVGWV
ncbi:hypothetical protein GR7B_00189 [Vibrio phage vB_VcorM_GR7B]|nr:hypothetical protein GR7B_00189 [Vibrio phage vB_VcorM_GR7B]